MSETQWMTLLETSSLMNKLPTQVTRMCEDGKLEYYREDGRYFVSRESIDLFMHPHSGRQVPSFQVSNGTSRRKYGQAPGGFEEPETPVAENETVNGQAAEDAAMEETLLQNSEENTSDDDRAGMSKIDAELDSFIKSCKSMVQESPGHSDLEPVKAGENSEAGEYSEAEAGETPEARVEAGESLESDSADRPESPEEGEAVLEQDAVETLDASNEPDTSVDRDSLVVEEAVEATTAAEEVIRDARERSVVIPEKSTRQVADILSELRGALARHAAAHETFCDEISRLADALESTLTSGEDKTSELTREISSLLARYSKR